MLYRGEIMVDLYNGDCLEIMKDIPDNSIDAIITDPPYGTTACKWDSIIPFDLMWEQLNRIIKPNGVIALFGSEPFSSALRMSNIKEFKYDWIWEKNTGSISKGRKKVAEGKWVKVGDEKKGQIKKKIKQTDSKEFKSWFGDSKVVDKSGKPLVVYHGSNSQFNKFNSVNDGIYFAKDTTHEFVEGTNFTYSSFIKIEKPYYTKKRAEVEGAIYKGDWNNNISFAAELKKKGYDGIIYEGGKDDDYPEVEYNPPQYVAFNPNQVKSATGNKGSFNPKSNDMNKANKE